MKRGNFSVLALGILFLLFMTFILFYKPNLTPSVTGYFVFDPKEIVVTNVSIPLDGNFSFEVTDADITSTTANVTNNSFVRVLILTPEGKILSGGDVQKTFEEIAKKTIPEITFNDYTIYKTPKKEVYKISIKEFGITPSNNGTYKLIFDVWYDLEKRKTDARKDIEIKVNVSSSYVPPSDNVKINNAYILGAELDEDEKINKTKTTFVVGDALLCYVNFTNKTAVTMTFKYYKKSDSTTTIKTITTYQCDSPDLCFGKYVLDKFEDSEAKCVVELNNSLGNFISDASSFIKLSNMPPVLIEDIPDINVIVGEDYVFDLDDYFLDSDGGTLVYDAVGTLHAFMNITGSEVTISGAQAYAGSDVLTFKAIDNKGTFVTSNDVIVYYNGTSDGSSENSSDCKTDWTCTEFSTCISGYRTRICNDGNECDVSTGKPSEKQKCTTVGTENEQQPAESNKEQTVSPLTRLKESESSGGGAGLIILIVVIVLVLLGGGGAVYYFQFYKKTGEEEEETVKEVKKDEAIVGGVTGSSTLYQNVENKTTTSTVENKTAEVKAVEQPAAASNVDEIYKYFEQAADLNKAKEELLTAGWDKKDVQRAFDVTSLRKYVAEKIKAGFDKEKLKESLKSKGWKQDVIDDVFKS